MREPIELVEFLAPYPDSVQALALAAREKLLGHLWPVTEIFYDAVNAVCSGFTYVEKVTGNFVNLAVYPDHVTLIFPDGAKLKDTDIASRPKGVDKIPDDEILAMLRNMQKSRRESVELYRQGNRPELAAKEEAEIAVIEAFLPAQMDDAATKAAVDAAVAETGAASVKDMGKVMAALKARHGATLDMSKVGGLVKAALA